MSSFVFFLLLTMLVAFVMNWVFMQYLYVCTDCTHSSKHTAETEKLASEMGASTDGEDMDEFLN
jgi:hypothetical protein